MNLTNSEKKVIIDKLHKEGWKDKDIKNHLNDIDKNLRITSMKIKREKLKESSFKKTNDYFKQEFNKLFE